MRSYIYADVGMFSLISMPLTQTLLKIQNDEKQWKVFTYLLIYLLL